MARLQLVRMPETGELIATTDGNPIHGAFVKNIDRFTDLGVCAVIYVPIKEATFSEMTNVVPLVRPVRG